jgi:hypothetical protein
MIGPLRPRVNRARRVKCDETRPICQRCQKANYECDGFDRPTPLPLTPSPKSSRLVPLLPRTASFNILRGPAIGVPGEDLELRYFQLFQNQAAPELSAPFNSQFWTRLVLQESYSEPAIRHAVVAVGALHKTMVEYSKSSSENDSGPIQKEHHDFALRQFHKAICQIQERLSSGNVRFRLALISCLLFVCFESFHGDLDSAMAQVFSGLNLLRDWYSRKQMRLLDQPGILTPDNDDSIETEFLQMFIRLEYQARSHILMSRDIAPEFPGLEGMASHIIPPVFNDFAEAKSSWDVLLLRALRMNHSSVGTRYRYLPPHDIPQVAKDELAVYVKLYQDWYEAFAPLFERAHTPEYRGDLLAARMLKVHWSITRILISLTLRPAEIAFDQYLKDFREIISLSQSILMNPNGLNADVAFCFDLGIIAPLHTVAIKCRDRVLRHKALRLLCLCPRREGTWDSALALKSAAWMIGIEEEGMNSKGFIPEESRVKMIVTQCDLHLHKATVKCGQMIAGSPEAFNIREITITW